VTAQPAGRSAADRAASDPAPLLPTATTTAGPFDHVTAAEIAEFLAHLARFRSPALGGDPTDHAVLLARKAELFTRIAEQHARTAAGPPPPTTPPPTTPPPTTPPPTTPMAPEGRTP
jgi:hypothetical protein